MFKHIKYSNVTYSSLCPFIIYQKLIIKEVRQPVKLYQTKRIKNF